MILIPNYLEETGSVRQNMIFITCRQKGPFSQFTNSAFKIDHLFTIEPYTDIGPYVALIKSILFIFIGYLLTSNKSKGSQGK